jgi:thioesterase domain-containing protein
VAAKTKRPRFRGRDVEELPAFGSTVVNIQAGSASKRPLFCVHAEAGDVSLYYAVARHLPRDRPVFGLRAPPPSDLGADIRLERLAEHHVRSIRGVQPDGPYLVVGECTGGALAYEIAQQLHGAGEEIALLALVDAFAPGLPRLHRLMPRTLYRVLHRIRILGFHLGNLVRLDGRARLAYAAAKAQRARMAVSSKVSRLRGGSAADGSPQRAFTQAIAAYEPVPCAVPVVVLRAAKLPLGVQSPPDMGWGELVDRLQIETVPGYFTTPISEPGVRMLADALARHLVVPDEAA